ncbi:uncharacterized protein LOC143915568 [Arctopsyche grandis]|uniref:uncharacterized protein LOC143915568 n=1 Tax=Arctopsyche grandis TaxID=121162 RepID=UPI00406D7034
MDKKDPREMRRRKIIPNISSAKNNTSIVQPKINSLPVNSKSSDSTLKKEISKNNKSQVFILSPDMLKKFGINIPLIPKKTEKAQNSSNAIDIKIPALKKVAEASDATFDSSQILSENSSTLSKSSLSGLIENETLNNFHSLTSEELLSFNVDDLNFKMPRDNMLNSKLKLDNNEPNSLAASKDVGPPPSTPILTGEPVENNSCEVIKFAVGQLKAKLINRQIEKDQYNIDLKKKHTSEESDISQSENSLPTLPLMVPDTNKDIFLDKIISALDLQGGSYTSETQIYDNSSNSDITKSATEACIQKCNDVLDQHTIDIENASMSNNNDNICINSTDNIIQTNNFLSIDSIEVKTKNEETAISLSDQISEETAISLSDQISEETAMSLSDQISEEIPIEPACENINIPLNASMNYEGVSDFDSSNNANLQSYCLDETYTGSDSMVEPSSPMKKIDTDTSAALEIKKIENSLKMEIISNCIPGGDFSLELNNVSVFESDNLCNENSIPQKNLMFAEMDEPMEIEETSSSVPDINSQNFSSMPVDGNNLETENSNIVLIVQNDNGANEEELMEINIVVENDANTDVENDAITTVDNNDNLSIEENINTIVETDANATVENNATTKIDNDSNSMIDDYASTILETDGDSSIGADTNASVENYANIIIETDTNITADTDANITVENDAVSTVDNDANATIDYDVNMTLETNVNTTVENDTISIVDADANSTIYNDVNMTNVNTTVDFDAYATEENCANITVDTDLNTTVNNDTYSINDTDSSKIDIVDYDSVHQIASLLQSYLRRRQQQSTPGSEAEDQIENDIVVNETNTHGVEEPGGVVIENVEKLNCVSNSSKENKKQNQIKLTKNHICKCAVCHHEMPMRDFTSHSFKEHNLLAWMEGEKPIDLSEKKIVLKILNKKLMAKKKLKCEKCSETRSSAVGFLSHMSTCQVSAKEVGALMETCPKCDKVMLTSKIKFHMSIHTREARKLERVKEGLQNMKQEQHFNESDVTTDDVLNTESIDFHSTDTVNKSRSTVKKKKKSQNICKCAVCNKEMPIDDFHRHSLNDHNLLAWIEGETPLDLFDTDLVLSLYKKKLKLKKKLKCETCGELRSSIVGFQSHQLSCQKSDQEITALLEVCQICNRSMLPASLKVHLGTHAREDRLKRLAKLEESNVGTEDVSRKRKAATKAIESFKKLHNENDANDAIATIMATKTLYTKPVSTFVTFWVKRSWREQKDAGQPFECYRPNCDYKDTSEIRMKTHFVSTCPLLADRGFTCNTCNTVFTQEDAVVNHILSDHPDLLKSCLESKANDENYDNVDFDLSDESDQEVKCLERNSRDVVYQSKKFSLNSVPFGFMKEIGKIGHSFYQKHAEVFASINFAKGILFKDIVCNEFLPLSDTVAEKYLPANKESCNMAHTVHNSKENPKWKKYSLFESELTNGAVTMWCGGPVWSLEWVPGIRDESFLTVAADSNMDSKYLSNQVYSHDNIIQFWNVGNISNENEKCLTSAKMAFAIAHSHGVVWDMDWCPSGCDDDCNPSPSQSSLVRMGLLAVACSNGKSYIYSIPNPSCLPHCESKIYTTKPVMELSFEETNSQYSQKNLSQARKITWSQMKGHKFIAIGYTNGFVALFDITLESPLLKLKVSDNVVLLPYFKFQPYTEVINGLLFMPQHEGSETDESHGALGVSSLSGCSIWVDSYRVMKKRGRFMNITSSSPWPQLIAISEAIINPETEHNKSTFHVIVALTARFAGFSELYLSATHYFPGGGSLDTNFWSDQLLATGVCGQLMSIPIRTPLLKSHHFNKKRRLQFLITYSEEINLSGIPVRPELPKGNPIEFNSTRTEPLENFVPDASTYKEAKEIYGLQFVDILKTSDVKHISEQWRPKLTPIDRWPLQSILSLKSNPSSTAYFFNAFGGRAGQVRIMCSKYFSRLN